ncbi:toxin-antitoxin system, toxin component, RelE family, partial [human gut metagenome]
RGMNSGIPMFQEKFHPLKSIVVGTDGIPFEEFFCMDIMQLFDKNWKIIYRYDAEYDRIILVDLWNMRRNPKYLIRQFRRKL